MVVKVAINGFGRIGRPVFRAAALDAEFQKHFELVAVNSRADAKTLATLLKYDTVHGKFNADVKIGEGAFTVNGKETKTLAVDDPAQLPWKAMGIDFVVESTGAFTKREGASKHLTAGAKKVLISAPAEDCDVTLVPGVNHEMYNPNHKLISMASCTTNCLAPVVSVLQKKFGIKRGFMTTCHAYTDDQRLLDGSHKDLRRARAAAENIAPTTTGAAKAIGLVVPELAGKLDGIALRVPVPDGSINDLTVELNTEVTKEEVNAAFKEAAQGVLKGIMEYTEEPLVSTDVIGNEHTSVVDGSLTNVLGKKGNFVKVFAWYDNEWAYANKIVWLIKYMAKRDGLVR
jgi:glyceraldehyde-3-phosphate dehydrogenase type I